MKNCILLSFDIEEFDIAREYGISVSEKRGNEISFLGTQQILPLLEKFSIGATFFVTAEFAQKNKEITLEIAQKHEIGSHSRVHSSFVVEDMLQSKKALEKIVGEEVLGFRMPRMLEIDYQELEKAGYQYDSSINPTIVPFRYNNLNKSTVPYRAENIIVLPASVTPILRIPLFWLSFKNFPIDLYLFLAKKTLEKTGYLNLYFHCWEFYEIGDLGLPFYIGRNNGLLMCQRLVALLECLTAVPQSVFITSNEYVSKTLSRSHLL